MWSNDIKSKYMFLFPLKNLARKGLRGKTSYRTTLWSLQAVGLYVIMILSLRNLTGMISAAAVDVLAKFQSDWKSLNPSLRDCSTSHGCQVSCPMCYDLCLTHWGRDDMHSRHFADDIFKPIFLNEYVWICISDSLKFISECLIDNKKWKKKMTIYRG